MGENTLIFVKKEQAGNLFYTAMKIEKLFVSRWYWFKREFHLGDYPENQNYWTPKQILKEIAGKRVAEDFVNIINNLCNLNCIIQGDYTDFPKEKGKEEDYIELTGVFYKLWDNIRYSKEELKKEEKKKNEH